MNRTETIKSYVLSSCRMDAVGIAPASALAGEPKGHTPEDILPGAKSVIVFIRRIPDGVIQAEFRNVEDGESYAHTAYAAYGSDILPNMNLFFMQFNLAEYIERTFGYTAVPIPSGPMQNVTPVNQPLPAFTAAKANRFVLDPVRAAAAAGLGDIGWNNMLVTEENGPRQRIGVVVTSMELDFDKPFEKKLCDPKKCGVCAKVCPVGAISDPAGGETDSFEAAGKTWEMGRLDFNACAVASLAFRKEFAGRTKVPDMIMTNKPSDEELAAAFAKKPISHNTLEHYPTHFCGKCIIYCPLGSWKERFGDTGLSKFDMGGLKK